MTQFRNFGILFKILLVLIFVFYVQRILAQNLVPNGDFEQYTACPSAYSQVDSLVPFWFSPTKGTPDYFNRCSGSTLVDVPKNRFGYQNSRSGDGHCGIQPFQFPPTPGIWNGYVNYREYLEVKLISPLVIGQTYDFKMYVNISDEAFYSISDIGVHFSVGQISDTTRLPLKLLPQITNLSGIISDTLNWILVSGNYKASGCEDHITIGNFKDDTITNYITNTYASDYRTSWTSSPYYFIDDVSLNASLPRIILGNDTLLCPGETLVLDASVPNATYLWQDGSTNSDFNVTKEGIYWVQIMDPCGNSASDTIKVDFNQLITIGLGNDTVLCQGQILTLNAARPNVTYLWQDGSTDSTFSVMTQGIYWVQVSDGCGSIADTVNVDFSPLLMVNLGNDTSLCQGQTLVLDATTPNVTYLWQDNSVSSTFNLNAAGDYWVQISSSCGSASDTVNVDINAIFTTVDLGNDTVLCEGQTLTLDATNSNVTYLWQDNFTDPTYNVDQSGTYWVQINDSCGSISDTINISYDPMPVLHLGGDLILCEGQTLTLDATNTNVTYLWQDNSVDPTLNVEGQGVYWVEVTNSCGTVSDTAIFDVEDCNCNFFVPNTFTPNNDNHNDLFSPKFDCDMTEYSFAIFDRWGELLFETNMAKSAWDGNYKGIMAQTGVYVYLIKYKHDGITKKISGLVSLLK